MSIRTWFVNGLIILAMALNLSAEPSKILPLNPPLPVGGIEAISEQVQYPAFAQQMCCESYLTLRFQVNTDGTVSSISVAKSGGEIFDQAAINAVKNTTWIPASYEDENISVLFELPFQFCIK